MTNYLLLIHIGPMQTFIAAARRTRDLWFGSWLMSELSKAAARGVAEQTGKEDSLIFPAASRAELQPGSTLAVANKIVAEVDDPDAAAQKAKAAMQKRLTDLAKIALNEAKGPLNTRETAEAQIVDLPEFYWVAVPLSDEKEYSQVRLKAESLLAARKDCRNFEQPGWGGNRPKSSLDGSRESVIPESAYPTRADSQTTRDGKIKALYTNYHARNAEQLSGVDLLKRLGKRKKDGAQEKFPSTSHMAALPLTDQLTKKVTPAAWKAYWDKLPKAAQEERVYHSLKLPNLGEADGSLLFASRLPDYFDRPGNGKNGRLSELADTQRALEDFYKATSLDKPNPYYALLIGDGDSMGKTINDLKTPKAHRKFSQTLAGFADQARNIIEKHEGAAVYTGGDDVLALLPLHTAVACAVALAQTFQHYMVKTLEGADVTAPTFSAGIAIFHHLEPLEDALAAARKAEKEAKSIKDKNALAVIESKRSGADRLAKGKWGELDKRLLAIAAFYQHERLPHGLAYQLRDMALHLGGETAVAEDGSLRQIIQKEAERIIKRKEGSEEAQQLIMGMIGHLDRKYTMTHLVNELIIANTVAQVAEQSGEKLPVPSKEEIDDFMDH